MEAAPSLQERYTACMVLAGVGDAMGYRNGRWEFNMSGTSSPPPLPSRGRPDEPPQAPASTRR